MIYFIILYYENVCFYLEYEDYETQNHRINQNIDRLYAETNNPDSINLLVTRVEQYGTNTAKVRREYGRKSSTWITMEYGKNTAVYGKIRRRNSRLR
jgi:hypothetical protein